MLDLMGCTIKMECWLHNFFKRKIRKSILCVTPDILYSSPSVLNVPTTVGSERTAVKHQTEYWKLINKKEETKIYIKVSCNSLLTLVNRIFSSVFFLAFFFSVFFFFILHDNFHIFLLLALQLLVLWVDSVLLLIFIFLFLFCFIDTVDIVAIIFIYFF